MAEYLSCEESNCRSDCADSVGSSKSESEVSLSCEFSSFEGIAALDQKQRTVPPLNHTSTNLWVAIQVVALNLQVDLHLL